MSKELKNEFKLAMVTKSSALESLRFYCYYQFYTFPNAVLVERLHYIALKSVFSQCSSFFQIHYMFMFLQVCGHKWADMSEFGRGVAVLNDSKYGYSAINNILRLSL